MKRERAVRGQRPRRGGPDRARKRRRPPQLLRLLARDHRKLHPDRRAGVVFVLHFGFRQRGAVEDAPINRLQAAIDIALLEEINERPGDRSFVARVHREIRLVPLPKHAQALEFHLMLLDEARRKLAAHAAKLRGGNFVRLPAQFLLDFRLDRQPVAIPAGDVRRTKPGHRFRFHNQIFQHLVQAGAQMDFSRRIGRPIVQHKKRRISARFQNPVVKPHSFPGGQLLRLALAAAWPSSGNPSSAGSECFSGPLIWPSLGARIPFYLALWDDAPQLRRASGPAWSGNTGTYCCPTQVATRMLQWFLNGVSRARPDILFRGCASKVR